VKKQINELVGRRNAIAHGVKMVAVSKADVERFQKYVNGVAKAPDKRLGLNLAGLRCMEQADVPPWRTCSEDRGGSDY
jgi:hypothetical protein